MLLLWVVAGWGGRCALMIDSLSEQELAQGRANVPHPLARSMAPGDYQLGAILESASHAMKDSGYLWLVTADFRWLLNCDHEMTFPDGSFLTTTASLLWDGCHQLPWYCGPTHISGPLLNAPFLLLPVHRPCLLVCMRCMPSSHATLSPQHHFWVEEILSSTVFLIWNQLYL